jgi:NAD(P)-dependent dehydrogenase (short-subunit alcohol dehydrogenase family)
MNDFEGKIVLITGAGRGLGRTLAYTFAARGAVVAANDITPVNLDQTLAAIRAEGGQVRAYESDIAKKLQVQTMVRQVLEDYGRIDCLVNNAGVHPGAPLLDLDEWDWRRTIDVNLTGAFLCTQIVGRAMREVGGGSIVNIAASVQAAELDEVSAVFAASKSALIGFTRAAARELAPHGIRVNAVCPAPILASHQAGYNRPASLGDQTGVGAYLIHVAKRVMALCSPASNQTSQVVEVPQL